MKESLESIAAAALRDQATDADLEALEQAILAEPNGANELRGIAEAHFVSDTGGQIPEAAPTSSPISWALAATTLVALAVGTLFLTLMVFQPKPQPGQNSHQFLTHQVSQTPEAATEIDTLLWGNEVPLEQVPLVTIDDLSRLSADTNTLHNVPEPTSATLLLLASTAWVARRRRPRR